MTDPPGGSPIAAPIVSKGKKKLSPWGLWWLILIGAFVVAHFLDTSSDYQEDLEKDGYESRGVVTAITKSENDGSDTIEVRYQLTVRTDHTATFPVDDSNAFDVGQEVSVRYNPDDLDQVVIPDHAGDESAGSVVRSVGVATFILMLLSAPIWLVYRLWKRTEARASSAAADAAGIDEMSTSLIDANQVPDAPLAAPTAGDSSLVRKLRFAILGCVAIVAVVRIVALFG